MVYCIELIGWTTVALVTAKTFYNCLCFFHSTYLGSLLNRNLDLTKYGPWAVVTGATDGIGKAYVKKLASLGLNIVLISRTQSKLKEVADEIRRENQSLQVKTIAVDFTESRSIYAKIKTELANVPVGILVNNVGMIVEGPFGDNPSEDDINAIVNCNIISMVKMTKIVLPSMKKKKRGLIINIGSLLGVGSSPMYTLYGATKAFVDKFSRDLAVECQSDGVIVQTVLPGLVATKLPGMKDESSLSVPTPETFVAANLRTLGVESRTSPYWFHKILLYVQETMHFFIPQVAEQLSLRFLSAQLKKKE